MNKQEVKRDKELLIGFLMNKGYKADEKMFLCPNPEHDDHAPSANVYENKFGEIYVKCFSCGFHSDYFELKYLLDNMGIEEALASLQNNASSQPKRLLAFDNIMDARMFIERDMQMEFSAAYNYGKDAFDTTFYVLRYYNNKTGVKDFRPMHKVDDKWVFGTPNVCPLFNLHKITPDTKVLIVEGEKCANVFNSLHLEGWVAVTSSGGSGAIGKTDFSPIKDNKCYIWRDNDVAGLKYQNDALEILRSLNQDIDISICNVDFMPYGEDIADLCIDNSDHLEIIEAILNSAKKFRVSNALETRLDAINDGTFKSLAFPDFPIWSFYAQANMPGTVSMLCGNPGAGKSFLIQQLGLGWSKDSELIKYLFLEEDFAFYQLRALAQLTGHQVLTDLHWVKKNYGFVKELFSQYRVEIDRFFKNVEVVGSKVRTTKWVAKWIIQQVEKGYRKVVVDPITATKPGERQWEDDFTFLFTVKEVLEYYGASLLATTHPRMGGHTKPNLAGMARGLAFANFTQYVYWLFNHDTALSKISMGDDMATEIQHNRTLFIEKTRNGSGNGKRIAIDLNKDTLKFEEIGEILTEKQASCKVTDF